MKLKCPKCGAEDTDIREIPRFKVTLEGFEGVFCDACYIRWVTANIPKLVPVERPLEGPTTEEELNTINARLHDC